MRRSVIVVLVVVAAALVGLLGWRSGSAPPPWPPEYAGVVSEANGDEVLVEWEHDEEDCSGAFVRHDSNTDIMRKAWGGYRSASWEDVVPGQEVVVWAGFIDDSCPSQTTAIAVMLRD